MGIIAVVSDAVDGATWSLSDTTAGFPNNPDPWQRPSMVGNNIGVDIASDPATSPYIRAGSWVGGSGSTWSRASFNAWWTFQNADGFILPPGYDVVDANLRVTRRQFVYDDSSYAADDDYFIMVQDWTPPLSGQWINLFAQEGADSSFFTDSEWRKLMSDRSAGAAGGAEGAGNFYIAGGEAVRSAVRARLLAGTDLGLVAFSKSSTYDLPDHGQHFWLHDFNSANSANQLANRPTLITNLLKIHDLNYVLGASVQMTDGTAVFLRYDRATGKVGLWYQKVSQTSATKIGDLDTTSAAAHYFDITKPSAQCLAICRDSANNIFVAGTSGLGTETRKITITAYQYNGGFSWTKKASSTTDGDTIAFADYHRGGINNLSLIWLQNAGGAAGGALAIQFGKRSGQWSNYETGTEIVNAGYFLGTAGVAKTAKYAHIAPMSVWGQVWSPFNPVGTGLDSLQVGSSIVTVSNCQAAAKSTKTRSGVHTFGVTPATNVPSVPAFATTTISDQPHDPDAKHRNVWMNSTTQYCIFNGSTLAIRNLSDHSAFRLIDFTTLGIANYPSKLQVDSDSIWDIIYDTSLSSFWIYYVDSQNPRHVRKIRYDHINNVLYTSFQLTGSPQGPSGSRIWSLRAPRGQIDARAVLLDLAIQDAAGVPQTLITLRDLTTNQAPTAPVLDAIVSFNASNAKTFDYTFTDPNPGDWETSHEIEVKRVSTGITVHSSGKISSTLVSGVKYRHTLAAGVLSNDTQYQIRVRSYDAVDVVGAWTAWTNFTTSATGGLVTILLPQTDNEFLPASQVTVTWSYSNTNPLITQNGYQVRVYNHLTNALISDSGIVASTATTRNVTGLSSDIQYRIEVQVRGTDSLLSGAGIRLVFPDFDNPPTPTIVAQREDGFVEILITNPAPSGENPVTVSNQVARKETGQADSAYLVIGTAPVNGSFQDYSVASGKTYSYKVRGASSVPVYSAWSNVATGSATVSGTWIQNPLMPSASVVHFLYGGVGKQHGLDRAKTAMQFVGRSYPVYDVGEARAETIQVTTTIVGEEGDSGIKVAAARDLGNNSDVILYRDGRGRIMYGIISDLSITDLALGSYEVQFLVNRVDYSEGLVAPS